MPKKLRCPDCGRKFIEPFDKATRKKGRRGNELLVCTDCKLRLITARHYRYQQKR